MEASVMLEGLLPKLLIYSDNHRGLDALVGRGWEKRSKMLK